MPRITPPSLPPSSPTHPAAPSQAAPMVAATGSNALGKQVENTARAAAASSNAVREAAAASVAFQQQVIREANDAGQALAGALFSDSEVSSLVTRPASTRDRAGNPVDAQPPKLQRKSVTDDQLEAMQEFQDLETRANFGIKPSTLTLSLIHI